MRRRTFSSLLLAAPALYGRSDARVIKNITVYKEEGRFGGWPANHGIWSWGNEIVVGFSAAYFMHKSADRHQYDNTKPEEPRLARSLDGGETWSIEAPKSLLPPERIGGEMQDLKDPINFTHPGFAMMLRLTDVNKGPSGFWFSQDRCKAWQGPFRFPLLGQPGIAARTDYIVNGKHDAFVFLTASKSNGKEGRVLCARTTDGGLNWKFVSYLGEEPAGFSIMPSSVRLSPSVILTATRVKQDQETSWIDLYQSRDNGASWTLLDKPAMTGAFSGNPPSMIRMKDGGVCLTYGYRSKPYSIRARISSDQGKTWGDEIMLRDDGAAWDLGYPRTVQRPDGKIVTIYYFAENAQTERIIAATIWEPPHRNG